ncbi:sensor histidine kinase [Peredibacter starrii]|uniref:histidine kinase n=1 Tax=Peredibacter starrii TaxID=28202 RepID=A0AAX4HJV3_9BACT|nr:HAMP domain-containing sensor histidine kinase [Peredibacter starrii]WPU63488.1 HAMP domain-containing sensor histidine kinase [Peredibacter starrii]
MPSNWTLEELTRYQNMVVSQTRESCRVLTLLGITLIPLYAILDYIAHRDYFIELSITRTAAVILFVLIFVYVKKRYDSMNPFVVGFSSLTLAATLVTIQCYILGGFASPYYAGVNLVLLAGILIFPVVPRQMFFLVTLNVLIYILAGFLKSNFELTHLAEFLNNTFVLMTTGIIGVIAAKIREEGRIQSFNQVLQIEKNQTELEASRDILQLNLQSEQDNVAALVQEITSRKAELEKALILAEHAKLESQLALSLREEFISLASHELKTPITSLTLQTQLYQRKFMKDQTLEPDQLSKLFMTYDLQLKRLTRIISDMLDISRIQAGKFELEVTEVDLEMTVKQVVDLAMSIERVPINLVTQGSVKGHWDAFRIEQAVLNLVTNAIKYGRGMPIDITLKSANNAVIIEVADRGIGIRPEHLGRIFDRFERAVGHREFAGLGLGLYITKQIVEAHGGKIQVESVYNEGSKFTITLPLK